MEKEEGKTYIIGRERGVKTIVVKTENTVRILFNLSVDGKTLTLEGIQK